MMPEFTVQFDRRSVAMEFSAAPAPTVKFVQLPDPSHAIELARHRQAIESTLASIADRLERSAMAIGGLREQLQQTVVRYAETVAKSVFTQEPELIAQRLKEQLRSGLAEFDASGEIQIWVHTDCRSTVEQIRIDSDLKFQLHADSLLEPGDCRIESADHGLIARLEKRLEFTRSELLTSTSTGAGRP